MTSKKRICLILIIFTTMFSSVNVYAYDNLMDNIKSGLDGLINSVINRISDINSHWAKDTIAILFDKGIINGFLDGTFRPDNNITVAEFTKIIATSNGQSINADTKGEWYMPYVDAATNRGIIRSGEFKASDWDRHITRGEMARMVSRALPDETHPQNLQDYIVRIKDFDQIEANMRQDVLFAYYTGIMGGYPDGSFKAGNKATRAEASTMIERLITPTKRLKVEEIKKPINRVVYQDELGYGYIEGPEDQITDEVYALAKSLKPLRFEVIADKEMQERMKWWFGIYYLIEHDIKELWDMDWTFNIMCTSHPDLNIGESYNYNKQKYEITKKLDSHWAMSGTFITYASHDVDKRIWLPMSFHHFENYGTREYRSKNKFKEGDIITYKIRSRRPLSNDPLREKTDVYFVYEQIISVKLKDLR